MKYLKFYDLEETYINNKSSLQYFNVSYTKDTDKTWVKEDEEEDYLLMKFKVEEAIIIDDNDDIHKVLTRKICNDLSVFKSIQIGNDEPINIELEEIENIIDSNSFILNETDYFTSTYIPENHINGEQQCTLVINEQFTKDDSIVIFSSSNDYPYVFFSISEAIAYGFITEINENTFDVGPMSNEFICFVIKKEGAELLRERSIITSDMLQYIISSSLKYNEIKNNEIYLPSVEGEYMVKGVLNQSINSLSSLFSNNVNYEYTENTNNYDDIEINNDYEKNIINLISINIPKQIYYLYSTFNDCKKLKEVKIDDKSNLTEIGNYTFSRCSSLSDITIPNSVISIGYYAFTECSSLTSIEIPNSVISIEVNAISYCSSLTKITFEDGSQLQSIGDSAFQSCRSLSDITIPDTVTSIGEYAFCNCYSLTSIEIPSSVTSIGANAFYNCNSLSEIICLATTAPAISSDTFRYVCYNGILYYPQGSDYSSWLLTSYFYLGYRNWVGVELQDSYDFKVNFITNGVRVNSPYNSLIINGIQGVKQSDNSYLFSGLQPTDGCYKFDLIADGEVIEKVDIKHKNKWILVGNNSSMLTCIYYPCQSATIYNGNKLTYSGAYVDGVYKGTLSSNYTFTEIGEHIIQYSSVTSIGTSAFTKCYSLSSIDIPNSVTSIGNSAFYYCTSLSSIDIPSSVTSIGDSAFYICYSLSDITIPNSVTSIGTSAFSTCTSLSSITIGNSVTSIGDIAFFNCYSLKEITCLATTAPSIQSSTFEYISYSGVLYYPQGSDYSSWLSTDSDYLGYYKWTFQEI